MEGLQVADADLTVYIHPSKENMVNRTILRQLSSLLFTYNEKFDGILIAFEVLSKAKKAKILPGLIPYFGVKVRANLLLFLPKPDMLIEGKVVKLGKESIHVIVLGFCSAAIMADDIRDEFKYKIKGGNGIYTSKIHKRHTIKDGSIIQFSVKSMDEEFLHIYGSLIPTNTGCIRWLSKYGAESDMQINRTPNKHKPMHIREEAEKHYPSSLIENDQASTHSRPHKSRKRKAED